MYVGGMCVLDVLFPDGSPAEVWDLRGIIFCRESFSDGISLNTLKLCFQSANITKCLCGCCGFGMLKAQLSIGRSLTEYPCLLKKSLGPFACAHCVSRPSVQPHCHVCSLISFTSAFFCRFPLKSHN